MKKAMFLFTLIALVLSACQKQNLESPDNVQFAAELDQLNSTTEIAGLGDREVPIPIIDLVITSLTTNIDPFNTTTACIGTYPNVGCRGGQRQFRAFIKVKNEGTGTLPAGSFDVLWKDDRAGSLPVVYVQTYTHDDIPSMGVRPFYYDFNMGPCDCYDTNSVLRFFQATIDPVNEILEWDETNNGSPVYETCDYDCRTL